VNWLRGREANSLQRALEQGSPSHDPEQRELLDLAAELSSIELGEAPDPTFRAETRQRLLAMAEQHHAAAAPTSTTRRPAFLPVQARLRRLSVAVAVVAALVAVVGLLNVASRDALPGDNLYAVKRGSEQVQLALTFDPQERGYAMLHHAETRLDEVTVLVRDPQAAAFASPGLPLAFAASATPTTLLAAGGSDDLADGVSDEVVETLADMDRQTQAGIALLTGTAVDAADQATLDVLPVWAAGQQDLLGGLVEQMTAQEQDRAQDSLALLDRVGDRARSLGESLPCQCLDAEPTDELGPVPCVSCAEPSGTQPTGTQPTSSGAPPS